MTKTVSLNNRRAAAREAVAESRRGRPSAPSALQTALELLQPGFCSMTPAIQRTLARVIESAWRDSTAGDYLLVGEVLTDVHDIIGSCLFERFENGELGS